MQAESLPSQACLSTSNGSSLLLVLFAFFFFVETESHSVVHWLHPGLTVILWSLERTALLISQSPRHWNWKRERHHVRGYFSPFSFSGHYETKDLFFHFRFRAQCHFCSPSWPQASHSFLHARITRMCHHAQLKGHAPLNHLSPAPSLPLFWKWFPSLGSDRLKYWRLYLVSSHFPIIMLCPSF